MKQILVLFELRISKNLTIIYWSFEMSWYQSMTKIGTIPDPKGIPDPEFAFPATVHWMRALRILVEDMTVNPNFIEKFYDHVKPRKMSEQQINTIFGQLLYAVNLCSALRSFKSINHKADIAEVGIVTWYYGIYASANAMVIAQSGTFEQNHTKTANSWDRQIAQNNLIPPPFDLRVSTLVEKICKIELSSLYSGSPYELASFEPVSKVDAIGAVNAYLSGSTKWWREKFSDELLNSKEFKKQKLVNFRKKVAQQIRNQRLNGKVVGFMHQAFRYRGKANYRDSMYLGHGTYKNSKLAKFDADLSKVLEFFVSAAGEFCSRRMDKQCWNDILNDIESNRSFSLSPKVLLRERI